MWIYSMQKHADWVVNGLLNFRTKGWCTAYGHVVMLLLSCLLNFRTKGWCAAYGHVVMMLLSYLFV